MDKEIVKRMLKDAKGIYGSMYGDTYIDFHSYYKRDKIIFIEKQCLDIGENCLTFVWGMPGPDVNYYYYDKYGKTWAFNQCDIEEPELPTGCARCKRCIYAPMQWGKNEVSLPKECPRSKLIISGIINLKNDFDGGCKTGIENPNKWIVYPIYKPRKEDLYKVMFVQEGD